ncbi:hypothetical protein ISF_05794 [Cordyceps fumosorosea ARSEF 2679]|uniref:Uncharacterized protein n=1 Tax=Cordyceps fumosorosea (strain ARSEF 2679) TaxID=1081104 RepID=A0A167TML6_CORFA|nr:hypothetical protein ISF_05794 [Cordyceps fumosorosea ARSEF 2679]OAA60755.1 hypothetical protein ISF_05794 [Cordyceps fumosorosea ARSEF 2679]
MKLTCPLMLSSIVGIALGAAISARQDDVPKGFCCFHLQDTISGKLLQQDAHTHELFLDDPSLPAGWYCINQNAGSNVLYDRDNNACILTDPGKSFECLDGTPGGDTWQLVKNTYNAILLEDYGSTDFNICDTKGRRQIFGADPPSGLSCQKTKLATDNRTGECKW